MQVKISKRAFTGKFDWGHMTKETVTTQFFGEDAH
jgi:hypothetical protein